MAEIVVRRAGAAKQYPFTICTAANPALETPWNSGVFVQDPIFTAKNSFLAATQYIEDCLFGSIAGIKEQLLSDPAIGPNVRVISIWDPASAVNSANALVAQDGVSNLLIPRRTQIQAYVSSYSVGGQAITADVIYAVSASGSHNRASTWFTSDDDNRPGVPFTLDAAAQTHRFFSDIPGTIAVHSSVSDVTPLHEFQHAISSYTNGSIVDLYVDSGLAVNCKVGRPIPSSFCVYNGSTFLSDPTRDTLGYPPSWKSYHCALIDSRYPAVMDDYYKASTGNPLDCQNDEITRQFVLDRIRAKFSR